VFEGLIDSARTPDELAGVIAHEVVMLRIMMERER
jgi:predicted Zn-dependent protease